MATNPSSRSLIERCHAVARWFGILSIAGGVVMIIARDIVWVVVSAQLREQRITVAEDAPFLAGSIVDGPFTALAQADIINTHAMKLFDGKTYAELEQNDPTRAVVMNASFLRASLFTSVVSFGVAAFAIGAGLVVSMLGWSVHHHHPCPKVTCPSSVGSTSNSNIVCVRCAGAQRHLRLQAERREVCRGLARPRKEPLGLARDDGDAALSVTDREHRSTA